MSEETWTAEELFQGMTLQPEFIIELEKHGLIRVVARDLRGGSLYSSEARDELEKVLASKKLRSGQGKMRNRRYTMRRGPLVIYKENNGIARAFRAIPGVELCSVDRLNPEMLMNHNS